MKLALKIFLSIILSVGDTQAHLGTYNLISFFVMSSVFGFSYFKSIIYNEGIYMANMVYEITLMSTALFSAFYQFSGTNGVTLVEFGLV